MAHRRKAGAEASAGNETSALDARILRRWAVAALTALGQAREEIDALNVFPVPDGDTGTNLYLTLEAAVAAIRRQLAGASVAEVANAYARGALLGARGNSGVIVAQLLRGWADVLAEHGTLDAAAAREAFARSDRQAWAAVADPVEGTILSVSRAAALAAAQETGDLAEVVDAALRAARLALARTPAQLEILRRAGVVDAGGRGFLLLIEVLADVLAGHGPVERRSPTRPAALPHVDLGSCDDIVGDGPGYEVMYLLDTEELPDPEDDAVAALRSRLAGLGDSLVVVGGAGLWHVHVHVDDAGAAIEAGLAAGRIHQVRITHFADQVGRRGTPRADVGLVACAAGPGLAAAFAEAGAIVVRGWPVRRPSTAQILGAIHEAHAATVVVLPNDGDTLAAAEAAAGLARQEGIRVSVLPTRAQVQGLAAAAVHDPGRGADDDVVKMTAAAGATRAGAVTVATREAITSAGMCRVGDILGVVDGDFALIGDDLTRTSIGVVDRLLGPSSDLVTLVTGSSAVPGLLSAVRDHVHRTRLDVEVCVVDGGQERYPLLIGVE